MSRRPGAQLLEAVTVARLVPAIALALSLQAEGARPYLLLDLVVALDIGDGAWARAWSVDSDRRRALDSVVDGVSIHAVFLSYFAIQPRFLAFYIPIALSALLSGLMSTRCIRERHVLVIGGPLHKASSLSDAVFGAALLSGSFTPSLIAGVAALAANVAIATNYAGCCLRLLKESRVDTQFRRHTIRGLEGLLWLSRLGTSRAPVVAKPSRLQAS